MAKKIFLTFGIIGIFCLGAAGGIWSQAFLLPYWSSHSLFQNWQFVKEWSERTTVIREIREVTVSKEEAVARVAERVEKIVVGIASTDGTNTIYGSGLIITSDGFVLTLASVVPLGYKATLSIEEQGETFAGQVLKRDGEKNLVILKIEETNLPVVGFASTDSVHIGDSIVMVAKVVEGGELVSIVQGGTIRTKETETIRTNMFDKPTLQGSPLFNLEGQIVGLSTFEKNGRLVAIPSSELREFSGF